MRTFLYRIKKRIIKLFKFFFRRHEPDFIIIGVQKSGTSSLHYYLNQHPNLVGSEPKEIHYFDRWINYGYSLKWYENHFKSFSKREQLFFESSPNYIYYESVAKKIHEFYPNIKLILVLRNPIERAYSAWNMYKQMFEEGKDFESKKGKYPGTPNLIHKYLFKNRNSFPGLAETIKIERQLIEKNPQLDEPSVLRRGIYVEQIKKYYKYFGKDQLLILGFNELINNLDNTLHKIYQFLGVKKYPHLDIDTKPRNKRNYDTKMNQQDYKMLEDFYEAYNQQLFNLIGRKIDW
jgi:hypothetical protein